jgi:Fungal Zn(2)-Cys(6) binuclear cluster domain/Fungal specific transcription factor domain
VNSRQRRVKCDGVRPVCGRCMKSNRQCVGFEESNRLILKDETETIIKRFRKRSKVTSNEISCSDPSTNLGSPASTEIESVPSFSNVTTQCRRLEYIDPNDSSEWYPITNVRMSPVYEQNQVALFCCRETVNLRTLSWIMADEKWIELLPEMMGRSEALTSVIHANASTYLAKAAGARATPRQALTHYAYALKALQRDLYDPVRQTSDETLFAIILLGVFDVLSLISS